MNLSIRAMLNKSQSTVTGPLFIRPADLKLDELRKLGAKRGIPGASSARKADLIASMPARIFDRDAAKALKRTPVTLFDPAGHLTGNTAKSRPAMPRADRRHIVVTRDKKPVRIQLKPWQRRAGLMLWATKRDLSDARVATGTSRHS